MFIKEIEIDSLIFVFCYETLNIFSDDVSLNVDFILRILFTNGCCRCGERDYVNCKYIIPLLVNCQAYSIDGNRALFYNIPCNIKSVSRR